MQVKRNVIRFLSVSTLVLAVALFAWCGKKGNQGVDLEKKVLTIGYLDATSGPAAAIGKPYAEGKRILAEQVNAGGSGILPDGWKIKMVALDHGYNPQKSVEMYKKLKDEVLFIGTSFGTPNTLPLRPMLKRDGIVAFPASLSSVLSENAYTPPLGVPYKVGAMRAVDFAVKDAGGAEKVKMAIVYQNDDYGKDGLSGMKKAAKKAGVNVVTEQSVAPGQKDFVAVVTELKKSGATHVLLSVLPSATGPIMGTAAKLQYGPVWVGNTPAWVDAFFSPKVIPSKVFEKFYLVYAFPYWGEDVPQMKKFLNAHKKYSKMKPDFYILLSYVQGLVQLEVFKKALKSGDTSRQGYLKAMQKVKNMKLGGLLQPMDLTKVPYQTSTKTRILKPDFAKKSWTVVEGYKTPKAIRKGKGKKKKKKE